MKAVILDRSSADSVNDFNETIQKLSNFRSPGSAKKKKTAEDVKKIMEDFQTNFPKLKVKKLKNFKKAD